MGNQRFRLSDMIPNAWFYKLRDMNTTRRKSPNPKKKREDSPEVAVSHSDPPKRKTVYKPHEHHRPYDTDESEIEPIKTSYSGSLTDVTKPDDDITTFQPRRSSPGKSNGVRLRASGSPRIANKKIQSHGRRSRAPRNKSSESIAMVKASVDPQEDFRESMMEMIVENNIKASVELEELLACYLSLNSDEYHHLIIKAFEQIWFDLPHLLL